MLSIQYHEFAENCASTDANQALSVAGHVWAVATVEAGTLVLLLTRLCLSHFQILAPTGGPYVIVQHYRL